LRETHVELVDPVAIECAGRDEVDRHVRRGDPELQPDVQHHRVVRPWLVAAADLGASAALHQAERHDRLLNTKGTKHFSHRTKGTKKDSREQNIAPGFLLYAASMIDDRTAAYVIEAQPLFEDLRQLAAQLAGLLVLAATGSKDASPA